MAKSEKVVEAILQASDNATVADYLVRRAADPVDPEWIRLWGGISQEGEFALLERADRLVDLRLAEFCQHKTTARALFHRDDEDTVLRSLVLSNRTQSFALPEALFRDATEEEWKDYPEGHPLYRVESLLMRITEEETRALFENPAISRRFLAQFLMAKHYPHSSRFMYWQALQPEMRNHALRALAGNPLWQQWKVFEGSTPELYAAWGLLGLLEVTAPYPYLLAELCEELPTVWDDDLATALQRWIPQNDEEREREVEDNRRGDLSNYQRIRRAASAALLKAGRMSQKDLVQSDDLALRCGAYMGGSFSLLDVPMTPELMQQGIRRDGWFAIQSMLRNPSCWKTAEARALILSTEEEHEVMLATGEEDDDTTHPRLEYWDYEYRKRERKRWLEKFQKEHPEWFQLKAKQTADRDPVDAAVDTSAERQSAFTSAQLADVRKTLTNVARWQTIQFCLLVVLLAALFFR
jgi:hypothetical protein